MKRIKLFEEFNNELNEAVSKKKVVKELVGYLKDLDDTTKHYAIITFFALALRDANFSNEAAELENSVSDLKDDIAKDLLDVIEQDPNDFYYMISSSCDWDFQEIEELYKEVSKKLKLEKQGLMETCLNEGVVDYTIALYKGSSRKPEEELTISSNKFSEILTQMSDICKKSDADVVELYYNDLDIGSNLFR